MSSFHAKLEEIGAVLERGGSYYTRQSGVNEEGDEKRNKDKDGIDNSRSETGDDASGDHTYTINKQRKNMISDTEIKHNIVICEEVQKEIKSEIPELELSDSKENIHTKTKVDKSDNPRFDAQLRVDVNSNNDMQTLHSRAHPPPPGTDSKVSDNEQNISSSIIKSKGRFNLSNILHIPANISVQRLPCSNQEKTSSCDILRSRSQSGNKNEDELSTSVPSSDTPPPESTEPPNSQEDISMVPPCILARKNKSLGEVLQAIQSEANTARPKQSHPVKEQWIMQSKRKFMTDSQVLPVKLSSESASAGPGVDQRRESGQGQTSKIIKQSPYFSQSPAGPGPQDVPQPYQVIRPAQGQARPAQVRQVRPGQARPQTAMMMRMPRPGMGRATPRLPTPRWPPPRTMMTHSRSLPTSVSPRQQQRFPPPPRYSPFNASQVPSRQFPPVLAPQFPSPVAQIPRVSPNMYPPEITLSTLPNYKSISEYQYTSQSAPLPNRLPPPDSFVTIPDHPQVRRFPPSVSVTKVNTPCMPVIPLPTLAAALAGLGQQEGRKKLVTFRLTVGQIDSLNTLGVREEIE